MAIKIPTGINEPIQVVKLKDVPKRATIIDRSPQVDIKIYEPQPVTIEHVPQEVLSVDTKTQIIINKKVVEGDFEDGDATALNGEDTFGVLSAVGQDGGTIYKKKEVQLAQIAKTGNISDLKFGDTIIYINCGSSTEVI